MDKEPVDYFNQPIIIGSKVLVTVVGGLKVCDVKKINKSTIGVTVEKYTAGSIYRVKPQDSILLSGEDLMLHVLKGNSK